MDNQPPSFEPRKRRPRPSGDGAQFVGRPPSARRSLGTDRSASASRPIPAPGSTGEDTRPDVRRPRTPVRKTAFGSSQSHDFSDDRQLGRSAGSAPASPRESRDGAAPRSYPPQRSPRVRQDRPAPAVTRSATYSTNSPRQERQTLTKSRMSTKRKIKIFVLGIPVLMLCLIVAWAGFLFSVGNSNLTKVEALTGSEDTAGTTYLLVGSDERGERWSSSTTTGMRADTIMVLHKPESGNTALVSIPRDTLVTYPDGSMGKLNGALNIGGQEYLVETVEDLTGLGIDHYIQIGMGGIESLTDAVGGIRLCLDYDVDDSYSDLQWTAGCHEVDGTVALQFSRMRYADPLGDIGRTARQRQVVAALIDRAVSPSTLLNPFTQKELVDAASSVVTVDESDSLMTLARAGLAMRDVMGADGLMGAPPIASMNHSYNGGSHVLLDPNTIDQFWIDLRDGNLTQDSFASF